MTEETFKSEQLMLEASGCLSYHHNDLFGTEQKNVQASLSKWREWSVTSQRLKKKRLHNFNLCFKDLIFCNKGLDTGVFPLCPQDSSHKFEDISLPRLLDRMIQILTEVTLKLVSSGSLEDVQEVGSVCYKNFSVSGTLFLKYPLLA